MPMSYYEKAQAMLTKGMMEARTETPIETIVDSANELTDLKEAYAALEIQLKTTQLHLLQAQEELARHAKIKDELALGLGHLAQRI